MNKMFPWSIRGKIGIAFSFFGIIGLAFFLIFSQKVLEEFVVDVKDREVSMAVHAITPLLVASLELDLEDQIQETIAHFRLSGKSIHFVRIDAFGKNFHSGEQETGITLRTKEFPLVREDGGKVGTMHVSYSLEDEKNELYDRYILFACIYLLALGGIAGGVFWFVRQILNPLELYAQKLDTWKIGEIIHVPQKHLPKELRVINDAFKRSSVLIFKQYDQMARHQEELEKAVHDRTQELAVLNDELVKAVKKATHLRLEGEKFNNIIFDATSLALSIRDENFCVVRINDAYGELFGFSFDELAKTPYITPEKQDADEQLKEALLSPSWEGECSVINKKGDEVVCYVAINKILYHERTHYVVAMTDLTALKKIEAQKIYQEQLLLQQSKLATMGEMIGNIAHQWRQPLTQISTLMMGLELTSQMGKLTPEILRQKVEQGDKLVTYMSQTIDDFRNFFLPNKAKKFFKPSEMIRNVFSLMGSVLQSHHITYELVDQCEEEIEGFDSEYTQVIMNLISNAKDVLIERNIENPFIHVHVTCMDEGVEVFVEDNAGGIDPSIIDKVFEPYFTTKHKSTGTGLGLYMSKMIIEKNMGGKIGVSNTQEGARFTIFV